MSPLFPASGSPFFLYFAFQHTHQPQFAGKEFTNTTIRGPFGDALAELDWGVGQVMQALKDANVDNTTFVFFTSDNGYVFKARVRIINFNTLIRKRIRTFENFADLH